MQFHELHVHLQYILFIDFLQYTLRKKGSCLHRGTLFSSFWNPLSLVEVWKLPDKEPQKNLELQ